MDTARYARTVKSRLAKNPTVQAAYRKVQERRTSHVRPDLIFVLGSQRSGTNVLRQSLSLDPYVQGFNEKKNSDLYVGWALRPEPEIRAVLAKFPNAVLLKPIQSVIRRPVADFLGEFNDYNLRVAWIYRDPVAVFRSRGERWSYKAQAGPFITEWNRINASVMDANDPRVAVVCYDQLTSDPKVFKALCQSLGVKGENLFHSGRPVEEVESSLSEEDVADIRKQTGQTLDRLDAAAAKFLAANLVTESAEDAEDGPSPEKSAQESAQRSAQKSGQKSGQTSAAG